MTNTYTLINNLLADIYAVTSGFKHQNRYKVATSRHLIPITDGCDLFIECTIGQWDIAWGAAAVYENEVSDLAIYENSESLARDIRDFLIVF